MSQINIKTNLVVLNSPQRIIRDYPCFSVVYHQLTTPHSRCLRDLFLEGAARLNKHADVPNASCYLVIHHTETWINPVQRLISLMQFDLYIMWLRPIQHCLKWVSSNVGYHELTALCTCTYGIRELLKRL